MSLAAWRRWLFRRRAARRPPSFLQCPRCGNPPTQIVFGNVGKTRAEVSYTCRIHGWIYTTVPAHDGAASTTWDEPGGERFITSVRQ